MEEDIAELDRQAIERFHAGTRTEAETLLHQAIDLSSRECDERSVRRTALLRDKRAIVLMSLEREDEAEREARRGLAELHGLPPSPAVSHTNARLHITLGNLLYHRGRYAEAATLYAHAAALFAESPNATTADLARAHSNAGLAARDADDPDAAMRHFRETLRLLRDGADEPLRLRTTRFLANALQDRGELAASAALFESIEPLTRPDPVQHTAAMEALGSLRERQGDPVGASAAYEAALESFDRVPRHERRGLVITLLNAAQHFANIGDTPRALRLVRRAVRWAGKPPSHSFTVMLAVVRADLASAQGRTAAAIAMLERSAHWLEAQAGEDALDAVAMIVDAAELRRGGGRAGETAALLRKVLDGAGAQADHPCFVGARIVLAELLLDGGDLDPAEAQLRLALEAEAGRGRPDATWRLFGAAAALAAARGRQDAAVLFSKLAVGAIQESRTGALRPLERAAYIRRREHPFRVLIAALLAQLRMNEAESVHALVQGERLSNFVSRDPQLSPSGEPPPLRLDEQAVAAAYAVEVKHLRRIGRDRALAAAGVRPDRARALKPEPHRARLRRWFDAVLEQQWVVPAAAEPRHRTAPDPVPEGVARLRYVGHGDGRMTVFVHTSHRSAAVELRATTPDLARRVHDFRGAILVEAGSVPVQGHELYDFLIAPVAEHLADIRLIHLALDPPLLHLPFAALHDGRQYLVERWAIAVDTGVSAGGSGQPRERWRLGAFAATKATEGLGELLFAGAEVRKVASIRPGAVFVDDAFTEQALRETLDGGAEIIHVASHFQLRPARPELSRLCLGDGRSLSLAELRRDEIDFSRVALLVLSACSTATPDAGALGLESLAGLAQKKGARTVLATLWPVLDESAADLTTAFYAHAFQDEDRPSLAEALRRAQAAMIAGGRDRVSPPPTAWAMRGFGGAGTAKLPLHPYRWAGFTLLGDAGLIGKRS